MKLPRDIDGAALIRALKPLGYEITRQKGSHVRVTTSQNGEHHETIPLHQPLKTGTLARNPEEPRVASSGFSDGADPNVGHLSHREILA
ncbi:type II toxin-antitoxin system HicA family toxin [Luteolibacter luteus]|uniref:type II toxin-antitoxin system HicA family toxin n=1 Tax=Luteolibacter luteus TaxID=2728835 RepID=UPI00197B8868